MIITSSIARASRYVCVLTAIASAPILGGCSFLADAYTADAPFAENTRGVRVDVPGDGPTFDLLTDCMPADLELPAKGSPRGPGVCSAPTVWRIGKIANKEEQAVERNRFQDYLLTRSAQQCTRHLAGFTGFQSTTNFTLNTLTTGVAAAAAIATAPATNILAAFAAFFSGTRAHFNEDIYHKLVAFAVVSKIKESRDQELVRISLKRTIQSTDTKPRGALMAEYTLEAAIGDVERYHQMCSFVSGLSALVDPKQKFEDTATGLKQRIELLRNQLEANLKQIESVKKESDAGKSLLQTNADIARQINVLQYQLLTAPLSVEATTAPLPRTQPQIDADNAAAAKRAADQEKAVKDATDKSAAAEKKI